MSARTLTRAPLAIAAVVIAAIASIAGCQCDVDFALSCTTSADCKAGDHCENQACVPGADVDAGVPAGEGEGGEGEGAEGEGGEGEGGEGEGGEGEGEGRVVD